MWSGTFGNKEPVTRIPFYRIGSTTVRILHSPDDDPDDYLHESLLSANSSLDIMMFTFATSSPLFGSVINRFNAVRYVGNTPTGDKKVSVRIAMESQQARWWSAYPTFKKLGIPTKLEVNPKRKLHHKVGIIDKERVILGSYNWTLPANLENDENTVVIKNSDIAKMFTDAFDELWSTVLQ